MPKKKKLKKKKKIFRSIKEVIKHFFPGLQKKELPDDPKELGRVLAKQSIEKFKKQLQKGEKL